MGTAFQLKIDPAGIGRLVFDLPGEKVNKMSIAVLEELDSLIEGLKDNAQIKALVLTSGKEDIFIAGADLDSFEDLYQDHTLAKRTIEMGHAVFNKIESLPFPTIAVINGACLGGGMELALACTYRIVADNPKTALGLPETSLGIFPGWGGTQRLPRLVGLVQGLTMILSGQSIDAKKAFKIKLADAIFQPAFLDENVETFVAECLSEKGRKKLAARRRQKSLMSKLMEDNFIGRSLVFSQSRKNVLKKTKGFYPSPIAALELVKDSYGLPLEKGLKMEIERFTGAMEGDFRNAPNLLQIYFSSEAVKKDPGFEQKAEPKPVRAAAVIGAGVMGSGIAWLMSYRDIPVRLKDINWEAVGKGCAAAWDIYKTLIKIRKLKPAQANMKFLKIAGTVDYSGFQHVDLVIEAAVENLDLKHKIIQELEEVVRPDTIIATNTSSLTIQQLAEKMKHPERLVGMHFFNPPSRMPLVEIVAGKSTSAETVATAVELCRKLKKTPVVVGDCPGFLVNRVFVRGFGEIMRMLEEGIAMERLEKLLVKFGMPMPPFVLADEVGNDVNLKVLTSFEKAYGNRIEVPEIMKVMNTRELYGKKAKKGFYLYENGSKKPNPEVSQILSAISTKTQSALTDEEVVDRVTLAMIDEAAICLDEGVVHKPENLDIALVFGTGFPPFRGGLLRYADSLGIETVVSRLKKFQMVHGDRYAPSKKLLEMAKEGKAFYHS